MLCLFASLVFSSVHYTLHEERSFLSWMRSTNQFYTGDEYQFRFGVFMANARYVREFNSKGASYQVALNHFAALTPEEYKSVLGYMNTRTTQRNLKISPKMETVTVTLDWRTKGVVNAVKNQLFCGSCWAFSAIQAVESVDAIKTGKLLSLSEQNLVDCCTGDGCQGCSGGLMDFAYDYVIASQGGKFNTEADYWYVSFGESCYFEKYEKVGSIIGYINIVAGSEDDLAAKVEKYGPAAVAIDASHLGFQLYFGGVYDDKSCSSTNLDHGVGCVGYGVEDNGTQYWIVRNSWGSWWGESGYIRMIRKDNQCGIATMSCIPLP